jgi:ATP-dependent protease ClpP protease subunit
MAEWCGRRRESAAAREQLGSDCARPEGRSADQSGDQMDEPRQSQPHPLIQQLARYRPPVGYRDGMTLKLRLKGPICDVDRNGAGIYAVAVEAALIRSRGVKFIECKIDSEGGSVHEAQLIHDMLVHSDCEVHTIAGDVCASAAMVVFLAGDFRQAESARTRLLMHCAEIAPADRTLPRWTAQKHMAIAHSLQVRNHEVIDIYARRTGVARSMFEREMSTENPLPLGIAQSWRIVHCIVGEER